MWMIYYIVDKVQKKVGGNKKQMEKQLYRRLVFSCYFEKKRYIMNIKNFIKG